MKPLAGVLKALADDHEELFKEHNAARPVYNWFVETTKPNIWRRIRE